MPEFVMEGRDHAARAESPFVYGFIEAMFFTECSPAYCAEEWFSDECRRAVEEGQSDGNLPGDVGYTDLHPDSLKAIRAFCSMMQGHMHDLLLEAYDRDGYDETQAGRDLFYTYVGHGVGYWDRKPLEGDDDTADEYERLTDQMREASANGDNAAWDEALRQRQALPASLGDRLSERCGRGEINPYFGEDSFVYVDLY